MGKPIFCNCGHYKSDHEEKSRYENYELVKLWRGECDWIDCPCLEFKEENHV